MDFLVVRPISQGQCFQRAGRAGRLGPGSYYVMLTEKEFDARPELPEPEIKRANLAGVVLQLLAAEVSSHFRFDICFSKLFSSLLGHCAVCQLKFAIFAYLKICDEKSFV